MSIAAMNWAMNQRAGAPSGQCVLYVLADVADPEGVCFPSIGYIAARSEQSRDTVRRRLREMEERGLLVRFERREKTGRQKSDEIRLVMGDSAVSMSEPDTTENQAESGEKTNLGEGSKLPGGGSNLPGGEGSTRARGGVALLPPLEPLLNQEKQPQSPFKGAVGLGDEALEKRVLAFEAVYPCATTNRAELVRLIGALGKGEYETLVAAAAGYAVHCAKEGRRHMDPAKFARSPDEWAGFAKLAPKPEPEKTFVETGSAGMAAWAVHFEIVKPGGAYPFQIADGPGGMRGAWLAGAFPPGGEALSHFADADGDPDLANWVVVLEREKNWWAWNERVQRWTGAPLVKDTITLEGEDWICVLNGAETVMPNRVGGRRLPSEWPPLVPKAEAQAGAAEAEAGAAHG